VIDTDDTDPGTAQETLYTPTQAEPVAEAQTYFPVDAQTWEAQTYYLFDDLGAPLIAGIPLFGSPEHATWALMNLVLTIVGVALALLITLRALIFKKEEKYPDEHNNEDYEYNKRRFRWLLAGNIIAIIGIILFVITQNMRNPMVLVDVWTIAHAIFVAIGIVSLVCIVKRYKDNDSDDEEKEFVNSESPA